MSRISDAGLCPRSCHTMPGTCRVLDVESLRQKTCVSLKTLILVGIGFIINLENIVYHCFKATVGIDSNLFSRNCFYKG